MECWGTGTHYFLRPSQHFRTGKWDKGTADDRSLQRSLEDIGRAAQAYGARNGVSFKAVVNGYASHKEAPGLCEIANWQRPQPPYTFAIQKRHDGQMELAFHNRLNLSSAVVACRAGARGSDGNILLAATRAAWAGYLVESAAGDIVSVVDVRSHGANEAFDRAANDDEEVDRTVVVELWALPWDSTPGATPAPSRRMADAQ